MVLRAGEMVGTHRVVYVIRPSFWVVEQLGATGSLSLRHHRAAIAEEKKEESEQSSLEPFVLR